MKEKKTSRRGKRILILLLLLFVTGIMLTTSTYAWFLANQTVTISSITVNVAAQNGIQVSVDGTSWRSVIQTTDITGANATYSGARNQLPAILEPVSTTGVVSVAGKLPMYYGVVESSVFTGSCSVNPITNTTLALCTTAHGVWTPTTEGGYILTATLENEPTTTSVTTGKFIAFDLFFKVDTQTQTYLTDLSGVSASGTDVGIKNASRIAFVTLGNTAAGSDLTTVVQTLNNGATSPVLIWEPNRATHTATGIANGYDYYGLTSTQITNYASDAATNYCVPYEGVLSGITITDNVLLSKSNSTATTDPGYCTVSGTIDTTITTEAACTTATGDWTAPTQTNTAFFDPVTINLSTVSGYTGYNDFLLLSAGITKVRIYMWVEGQDIDCENNASGGNIVFDLQISVDDGL